MVQPPRRKSKRIADNEAKEFNAALAAIAAMEAAEAAAIEEAAEAAAIEEAAIVEAAPLAPQEVAPLAPQEVAPLAPPHPLFDEEQMAILEAIFFGKNQGNKNQGNELHQDELENNVEFPHDEFGEFGFEVPYDEFGFPDDGVPTDIAPTAENNFEFSPNEFGFPELGFSGDGVPTDGANIAPTAEETPTDGAAFVAVATDGGPSKETPTDGAAFVDDDLFKGDAATDGGPSKIVAAAATAFKIAPTAEEESIAAELFEGERRVKLVEDFLEVDNRVKLFAEILKSEKKRHGSLLAKLSALDKVQVKTDSQKNILLSHGLEYNVIEVSGRVSVEVADLAAAASTNSSMRAHE